MTRGVKPTRFISLNSGPPQIIDGEVVEESTACLSVNGVELATFMCSPDHLEELGLGLLYNESIINSLDEIQTIHLSKINCIEIWLTHQFDPPERFIITAGCGGGVTFNDLSGEYPPLQSRLSATSDQLIFLMKELNKGAVLYQRSRGIHTAVLAEGHQVLLQVEDIGRHNCLDKLAGLSLKRKIHTRDRILLSSGRISSEMINKARRMEIPIVCSRTSPTSLSTSLAEAWNITIVAYLRQNRMRIYSHPERIEGVLEAAKI
jgi:FdhD protein